MNRVKNIFSTTASPSRSTGSAANRKRRAFTIAEVMIAAAVMALAISSSITVMQRAFLALDSARNITLAGQIMVSEMEKVRMEDWATVSGYLGTATVPVDTSFTSNANIGGRFSLTRVVTSAGTNMLQITFTVSWNNIDGRPLERSYTTYYARYGLHDYLYNS